jgi:hypothetical protein
MCFEIVAYRQEEFISLHCHSATPEPSAAAAEAVSKYIYVCHIPFRIKRVHMRWGNTFNFSTRQKIH